MTDWAFYGRNSALQELQTVVRPPRWFFSRIQGRRRIGKTALLAQLARADANLASRMLYIQVPDSDERDVVATFARTLAESNSATAQALVRTVNDFRSMAAAIGHLCRADFIVVLDEFQYFTRAALHPFNSFLQAQVDALRDTDKGGLFVLGSLQSEMNALLADKGAPLYGRLSAQLELDHWDFEDLMQVFRAHGLANPYQWLALWSFFEGVPKFYRDAYEQDLFSVPTATFHEELLRRMFLRSSSPLSEEADTWFLREIRGKAVSILSFLAERPGCTNGELVGALSMDADTAPLSMQVSRLVKNYRMVDKRLPVFSNSASRNARYYITDNFLQAWLAVAKPAREAARLKPQARAIELALPRLQVLEGYAFEKLIRHLHVECSRKGKGDFELSEINLGYWNRSKDVEKAIELDVVALSEEEKRVRFGSCKRSAGAHNSAALAKFEQHIAAFLTTGEGRKLKGWRTEKLLFSPVFNSSERTVLAGKGFRCTDLTDFATLY